MIPGFNHNIRYLDRTYHVQTEDSGPKNPVIITHLFIGGTILATQRSNYSDLVDNEAMEDLVRVRMQEQHKTMLRGLMDGRMDHLLSIEPAAAPFGPAAAFDTLADLRATFPTPVPSLVASPTAPAPSPSAPAPPPPVDLALASLPGSIPPVEVAPPRPATASAKPTNTAPRPTSPPPPPPSPAPLPSARTPTLRQPPVMLEPIEAPPRVLVEQPASGATPTAKAALWPPVSMPLTVPRGTAPLTIADALGAPSVNAAALAGAAPSLARVQGLFGEDLISDKSLDDVILQYLVEDYMAEEEKGKKKP